MATYSILAWDDMAFGAAVQSHWFAVGSAVPWLAAGVGGCVVQSFYDPNHGGRALTLLGGGASARETLDALLADDAQGPYRQTAVVDRQGRFATHTGQRCIPEAGHIVGEAYSAQANLMHRPTVWGAMARAFEEAEGDLVDRLLAALSAAEGEGGDIRGRQSAALVVVRREASGNAGEDRPFDLRVDDHPDPVAELARLIRLRRAYMKLNEGDDLLSRGDIDAALAAYRAATVIVPDEATSGEAAFWTGIALAGVGRETEAVAYLSRASVHDSRWAELVPRLVHAGILPDDPLLIGRLVESMGGRPRRGSERQPG